MRTGYQDQGPGVRPGTMALSRPASELDQLVPSRSSPDPDPAHTPPLPGRPAPARFGPRRAAVDRRGEEPRPGALPAVVDG
jgi:hypothetical protein